MTPDFKIGEKVWLLPNRRDAFSGEARVLDFYSFHAGHTTVALEIGDLRVAVSESRIACVPMVQE